MTDSMTYPLSTSYISLKIPSVFKPSHNNMVRSAEERFAMERMATRGFGSRKIAAALGVLVSTTQRWLQRLHSDGDMASRNIGRPLGAEAGVCVMFSLLFRLTSLGVSFVSLVCGSMAAARSAFVPQRPSTPGFLLTHAAQSPVCANVCRRLASSAVAADPRTDEQRRGNDYLTTRSYQNCAPTLV